MRENKDEMVATSSNIPIALPVSSDEIYLDDRIPNDRLSRDKVDATDATDATDANPPQPAFSEAFPPRSNDEEYWTVCCWLPCCLCAYCEISCPQKQIDSCRIYCCSCSVKWMDDCGGGNTYCFYYSNNNNNYNNNSNNNNQLHNNNNNDSCCCCFNFGDCINSIINFCNSIPCSCECCNALSNCNICGNDICEIVSLVFNGVSVVLRCVLSSLTTFDD